MTWTELNQEAIEFDYDTIDEKMRRDLATAKALNWAKSGDAEQKRKAAAVLDILAMYAPGTEKFLHQERRDLEYEKRAIDAFLRHGLTLAYEA